MVIEAYLFKLITDIMFIFLINSQFRIHLNSKRSKNKLDKNDNKFMWLN